MKELLEEFSRDAISKIAVLAKKKTPPFTIYEVPVKCLNGSFEIGKKIEPLWNLYISQNQEEISKISGFSSLMDTFGRLRVISSLSSQPLKIGMFHGQFNLQSAIISFVVAQLGNEIEPTFRANNFESVYDDLQKFLNDDRVEYEIWAPLENFDGPLEAVSLTKNFKIQSVPPEYFRYSPSWSHRIPPTPYTHAIIGSFELQKIIGSTKPTTNDEDDFMSILNVMLTAFRLLKDGAINFGPTVVKSKRWLPVNVTNMLIPYPQLTSNFPRYALSPEEFTKLREMYELVSRSKRTELIVAVERFNSSYERRVPEDQIVDQLIALESMFNRGNSELKFRLAVTIAFFLGKDSKDRRRIYGEIKNAYDRRSEVVHGQKSRENNILPTVNALNGYLRRALIRMLETKSEFLLEDVLFGNEK